MLDAAPMPDCDTLRPCGSCGARHLSVCARADEAGLRELAALAEPLDFAPDQTLAGQDEPAAHLFNITSGVVRVFKLMADGRRQIVGFLFAGDFLGLASGERYAFGAEAVGPVSACRFRRGPYQALLSHSPSLEGALLERASHDLRAAQEQMLLLGRKTATERLASFLADTVARTGHDDLDLAMSRAEIATTWA